MKLNEAKAWPRVIAATEAFEAARRAGDVAGMEQAMIKREVALEECQREVVAVNAVLAQKVADATAAKPVPPPIKTPPPKPRAARKPAPEPTPVVGQRGRYRRRETPPEAPKPVVEPLPLPEPEGDWVLPEYDSRKYDSRKSMKPSSADLEAKAAIARKAAATAAEEPKSSRKTGRYRRKSKKSDD